MKTTNKRNIVIGIAAAFCLASIGAAQDRHWQDRDDHWVRTNIAKDLREINDLKQDRRWALQQRKYPQARHDLAMIKHLEWVVRQAQMHRNGGHW